MRPDNFYSIKYKSSRKHSCLWLFLPFIFISIATKANPGSTESFLSDKIITDAGLRFKNQSNILSAIDITNVSQTEACAGSTITVGFTASGTTADPNVYSLEISDANGNFSNSAIIGNLSSLNLSGSISGLLPVNLPEGNGYLIRVNASNPQLLGNTYLTPLIIHTKPLAPGVSPVTYCQNSTAQALSAIPDNNHTLIWYGTNSIGGTPLAQAPTPQTSVVGNTNYYVSQSNDITTCESARAAIVVSIISQPPAPLAPNVSYCINATTSQLTATNLTGNTLQWYGTNATGGTASLTAPTPSSAIAGQTMYYVSQKNITTLCESARTAITVTINSLPQSPGVSNIAYCQNATSSPLTATASTNHTLIWYGTFASGGTGSPTAPTPSTTTAGSAAYYVSQRNNTTLCESPRASISVLINATPSAPGVNPIGYCQFANATQITATGLTGHTLLWYGTNSSGGSYSLTAPTPLTSSTGTTNYYVSQRNNSTLCESLRAAIPVTINSIPPTPTTTPVAYCINATSVKLTATANTGCTLLWYGTSASGGTGSTIAPIPDVSQTGNFTYYVSQKNNSTTCEGARTSLTVQVKDLPPLPVFSNVIICFNKTPEPLQVVPLPNNAIIWYGTASIGGTGTTEPFVPSTGTVGIVDYYLSQYDSVSQCESERVPIEVKTIALERPSITTEGLGSGDVTLTSSAENGNQWFRNSLPIPGATEPSYKISLQGLYQVAITIDGCWSELSDIQTILVTGLDSYNEKLLKFYPNPVRQIINLELSRVHIGDRTEIEIYDLSGKLLQRTTTTGREAKIHVQELPCGTYILSASNNLYKQNIRFVKD